MPSRFLIFTTIITLTIFSSLTCAQNQVTETSTADVSDILFSLEKADELQQPSSGTFFSASAELGILYLTGNTRSADIKTGLDFRFEKGLWRSFLAFSLLVKKTEKEHETNTNERRNSFETTDQKWNLTSQTNYTLDPIQQNYIYASIFYEENRFSGFDSQASISTGWGRRWFEDSSSSFDADIGPGFKRDILLSTSEEVTINMENTTQDTFILQAQALYLKRINEHIEFKQHFAIKHAIERGQNSIYKSESAIISKLIHSLQLKLNFIIDYNSKVDNDKKNVNTETSAVLIYSF